jgi:hypothetical protein
MARRRPRKKRRAAGIEGFAEDLGRLLGTAQSKAEGWIGQRQTIARQLEQIRDTASGLLSQLSSHASRRGRRRTAARALPARTRRLSRAARKAISDAQKRRWAAVKAAKAGKKA